MTRSGVRKGRGALSNEEGRFESYSRESEDDGWGILDEPLTRIPTTLTRERSRTIISHNQSPDVPFDQSINPYRGCEHGCIYCFARPTHTYLGWSAGLDFETKLTYKPDAAALLRKEIAKPGYTVKPLAFGANTDVYQPVERKLKITRDLLEVLAETRHPLTIVTKAALVERDIDLLVDLARDDLVRVTISVTTLDHELARKMEPRATAPSRRLRTIRTLTEAGIPVAVLFAPIIPALNDAEMEAVLQAVRDAGAVDAEYTVVRLPLEIAALFEQWLKLHFPLSAARTLARIRDLRDGRLYRSDFATRMKGRGEYASLLARRFQLARKRLEFAGAPTLRADLFRPPTPSQGQMALF